MDKRLLLFCFVLFGCLFSGCTALNVTQPPLPLVNKDLVKDFDSVTLDAPGVMEISQGTAESLEIIGDPNVISSITATVTDQKLVITSEKDLPSNSSITYKLSVKNLRSVLLNEFSVVKIPTYTSQALELTINGAGRIDIGEMKVTDLEFIINDTGNIEADSINSTTLTVTSPKIGSVAITSGETVNLALELGSGPFFGSDFKSTNVVVNMNGSGVAQVWSVEKLDVSINGSGQVVYYGEPVMSMNISGGGQLTGGGNK